jgi:hypothetical protein
VCGYTKKVHVIFTYNGTSHLIKNEIAPEDDQLTHVYTLIVHPNNTYKVDGWGRLRTCACMGVHGGDACVWGGLSCLSVCLFLPSAFHLPCSTRLAAPQECPSIRVIPP